MNRFELPVHLVVLLAALLVPRVARAQPAEDISEAFSVRLPLGDLSAFQPTSENWQITGAVYADRHRKRHLETEPGTGLLVNQPTNEAREHLFTTWKHGDLYLELDFMMPKGSNSGIYFMGRYEVQLFDSWGRARSTYADCGGIYQRWDPSRPEGERGYQGHPPLQNVARAPGLWQHLKVIFRAPRFNAKGEKIKNARFVKVLLNGVLIHRNVEVTGPTRGAAFSGEQPTGPLIIQGDHGPVAFRNVRYERYGAERVTLTDLRYRYYEGEFKSAPAFAQHTPEKEESTDRLTQEVAARPNNFALRFSGKMRIPVPGVYRFELHAQGGARLAIGGAPVALREGLHAEYRSAVGRVALEAGVHPFTLAYFKSFQWSDPALALYVRGPGIPHHELTAPASAVTRAERVDPILVAPRNGPRLLRSFVMHEREKRAYALSVGHPKGVHYTMDLAQGTLLRVWKGAFIDATPMWHGRGATQLARPRGSVVTLSGAAAVASLENADAPWPEARGPKAEYRSNGYVLDDRGRPAFVYRLGGVRVRDRLVPEKEGRILTRTLTFRAEEAPSNLWLRLAAAETIEQLPGGAYAVGDFTYYLGVKETGGGRPRIRHIGGHDELVLPIRFKDGEATLAYSIIW